MDSEIVPSESSRGPSRNAELVDALKQGLLLGMAILVLVLPPGAGSLIKAASITPAVAAFRVADFGGEAASPEAQRIAQWAVESGDNGNLFFVIVDKKNAKVFVFEPGGKLRGATPVLLGLAQGDDTVEGIGKRPLSAVLPEERTTPAGRFLAEPGRNASGEDVVWVDYASAVSMHRVRPMEPSERRLERLASLTAEDNRISYGCINVPVDFYEQVIRPAFNARYGVVYVLPETKPLQEVFAAAFKPPPSSARM
ncbi:MAG TPA: hypothetical protein VLJ57_20850 [Burkholderiaceae bacterium]|nr:hypothetical protein [Burkholderiaceae bacterium]